MKRLVIFGAGDHANEIAHIAKRNGREVAAIFGDNDTDTPFGPTVQRLSHCEFICGVGSPALKRQFVEKAGQINYTTLVDESVIRLDDSIISPGVVIFPGCHLTINCHLGQHVCLNIGASVHHGVVVEQFSNISPGARLLGNSYISDGVDVGANAVILPRVRVGAGSIVGAGAVVTKDVPPQVTVVGVPARIVKGRKSES